MDVAQVLLAADRRGTHAWLRLPTPCAPETGALGDHVARGVGSAGRRAQHVHKQVFELGGSLAGGEALASATTATTIKGAGTVTDGPFVETK